MKRSLTFIFSFFIIASCQSQREFKALRITEAITIDGRLDEEIWEKAEIATDFTNWQPEAGTKPSRKTEMRILYDDDALYLGAYMQTESIEEIKTQLTQRDDVGNTDFIGLILDTYGNGTEAAEFILSATGVQFDAKITSTGYEDIDWNEVWFSAVTLTDKGWYAEIKVPYYALRFPKSDIQSWRINLMRRMASTEEKCSFQYIDPEVQGFVNQSAFLKGVSNIKAPLRLSLSPYITGYYQHNKDGDGSSSGYSYNGGLDLKYGINDAFTLDMTLIPDFGQVKSDDQVLNLSPFEVKFDENRAFFTEGVELFRKANLFYTRRVGGIPLGYWDVSDDLGADEELDDNPSEVQLYNATKVSGRTKSGLGIGVFNAISGATNATIRNNKTDAVREMETSPLTNYNIVVLDQNLANNSFVSLINTNVQRQGNRYYDANVTGTEFDIKTKSQNWSVQGNASYSQRIYAESDNINGLRYRMNVGKISGSFKGGAYISGTSTDYSHNDLGFFTQSDIKNYGAHVTYSIYDGWKSFSRMNIWFETNLQTTYDENKFSYLHFNAGFWGQTKNLWNFNMWTNYQPESNDYYEPRQSGKLLKRPGYYNMGWWIGSDRRKKFQIGFNPFFMKIFDEGAYNAELSISPRYRFNDKFTVFLTIDYDDYYNILGYVDDNEDGEPIIGRRDRLNIENIIGINYTFNEKMSLTFRARHDWNNVRYEGEFYELAEDGSTIPTTYNEFNDFTGNFFTVDLNYTWRFAPGSDIIFVWKNSISGRVSDDNLDYEKRTYFDGINSLKELPQQNSISLRLVYFFNAQSLF